MKSIKEIRSKIRSLYKACLVQGVLDEFRVHMVVNDILSKRPRGWTVMLAEFKRLIRRNIEQHTVTITTAIPLESSDLNRIKDIVISKHGPGLNFVHIVDPSVIAGLRVQVGSSVLDGTIQARLETLLEKF